MLEPFGIEEADFRAMALASLAAGAAGVKGFDPWVVSLRRTIEQQQPGEEPEVDPEMHLDRLFGIALEN